MVAGLLDHVISRQEQDVIISGIFSNSPCHGAVNNWRRLLVTMCLLLISWLASIAPAQANLIRDTELESLLEKMIAPLEAVAGYTPGTIKIRIILDDQINAFVRNEQMIYVHSGLLVEGEGPLQFLGVMAHEIAHIKAGHVQRIEEDVNQANTVTALAGLAAAAAAAGGHGEAATGLLLGGTDRANRNLLSSVRRNESSADEIGLNLLDDAGISAKGLRDMMARLSRQRALPSSRQSEYYRTHPGAAQRLQTYQDHVNNSPHSDTPVAAESNRDFARAWAKIYAWTERPQTVLANKDSNLDPDLLTYAHAIAGFRRGDLKRALAHINSLTNAHPDDPFFHEFRGDILMSMAEPRQAADAYETAITLRPESPQILLLLGRALIAANDKSLLPRAIEVLSHARDLEPDWSTLHRQLGIAYGKAGQIGYADISLAEEAILTGDTVRAVQLAKRTIERNDIPDTIRNRANDIIFRYDNKN